MNCVHCLTFHPLLPSVPLLTHVTAHTVTMLLLPCNCEHCSANTHVPAGRLACDSIGVMAAFCLPQVETLLCISLLVFWVLQIISRNSFSLLNWPLSLELFSEEAANCQTNGQPNCTSQIFLIFYAKSTNKTYVNKTTRICNKLAVADN